MTQVTAGKNRQDIFIVRDFNAPKEQVYRLFIDKTLQIQWQSAFLENFEFLVFEPKNGGSYHSTHQGPDGKAYGFKGVYHVLVPNEKIIKTSEFLGLPFSVNPTLEILRFEQLTSKTTLSIQIICDQETTRDAMVQHGMKPHFDAIFNFMDSILNLT